MVLNGDKCYFRLQTSPTGVAKNYTDATLMFVLVPEDGPGPFYPLYDSGKTSSTLYRFSLRYTKGKIQLYTNNGQILSMPVRSGYGRPIIVILAFDGVSRTGRITLVDNGRTTRAFNANRLVGIDFDGLVGVPVLGDNTTNPDYRFCADMNVLQMDTWLGKALTFHEMESVATLISSVYGVGP